MYFYGVKLEKWRFGCAGHEILSMRDFDTQYDRALLGFDGMKFWNM